MCVSGRLQLGRRDEAKKDGQKKMKKRRERAPVWVCTFVIVSKFSARSVFARVWISLMFYTPTWG